MVRSWGKSTKKSATRRLQKLKDCRWRELPILFVFGKIPISVRTLSNDKLVLPVSSSEQAGYQIWPIRPLTLRAKGIEAAPRIAELPANPSQPFLKRGPFRIRALEKMFHSFYSLRGFAGAWQLSGS